VDNKRDPADGFPPPVAIVACQRSGTHLLREILNSNPQIAVVAEPLSRVSGYDSWHRFLSGMSRERAMPMETADAVQLFDEYMQWLRLQIRLDPERYGGPKEKRTIVGLDVKYNQVRCVNPAFMDLRLHPFVLDYFQMRGFRIVHLVRKNMLHQAISIVVANARCVYGNDDRSTLNGQYTIPIDELIGYLYWVRDERAAFENLSQNLPVSVIAYEDVVEDVGNIDADGTFRENSVAIGRVANLFEIPNRFSYCQCRPKVINRPYREVIANYDEVVEAVEKSVFSRFAESI
jgi:hypothetical protein